MSYILEALKKAEAERQLGAAPTIHAPMLDTAVPRAAMLRRPLVIAIGALAGAIAVLAAVLWQRTASVAPAAAAPPAVVAPPFAAVPAPVVKPAAVPAVAPPPPPPPPPVAVTEPAPVPPPVMAEAKPAPAAAEPAPATPAPKPPSKLAEEPVQALADLPEPIRRAIPSFSMDGYMYSANPADRLILIDKVLRREGDEVAPGLVLEKLLPKGAVFSFRGYRYRVAF